VLAATQGSIGVWGLVDPESFFDRFPGAGRGWVASLPPYNEHLVRDVGGLSLALAVVLAQAAARADRSTSRVVALGFGAYAAPHALFHVQHLEQLTSAAAVAQTLGLGLQLVLTTLVVVGHDTRPSDGHTSRDTQRRPAAPRA